MAHKYISSGNFVIACPCIVLSEGDRIFCVLLIKLRFLHFTLVSSSVSSLSGLCPAQSRFLMSLGDEFSFLKWEKLLILLIDE